MLTLESLDQSLSDSRELFAMARDEDDDGTLASVATDLQGMEKTVADMEFRRMFSGERYRQPSVHRSPKSAAFRAGGYRPAAR